jgi:hypothetical protein
MVNRLFGGQFHPSRKARLSGPGFDDKRNTGTISQGQFNREHYFSTVGKLCIGLRLC